MKTFPSLAKVPASVALSADDILEFHAARVLLLLRVAGVAGRIDGLTKLAKLDFFVRYPQFFEQVSQHIRQPMSAAVRTVESSMIRFHYGPWDKRYYHVLAYLEAKSLIRILDHKGTHRFQLTSEGKVVANQVLRRPSFGPLSMQMKAVKKLLGNRSGSSLKRLIYEVFDAEVASRPIGAPIQDDKT